MARACVVISLLALALAPPAVAGVTKIGSDGSGDGQFHPPGGLASDSAGNVYLADSQNNRIVEFDSAGAFVRNIGSGGSGSGQLSQPEDVAVDGAGNLYVADYGNSRIEKFGSDGAFAMSFGSSGTSAGQFRGVSAVALDAAGDIFAVDGEGRLQRFTPSGTPVWSATTFSAPGGFAAGLAVTPGGDSFVGDAQGSRIVRVSADGTVGSDVPANDGSAFRVGDVALDGGGNLLVVNSSANAIVKFDQAGALLAKWAASGNMPPPPNPVLNARPVATAADSGPPPPPFTGGSNPDMNPTLSEVTAAPNDLVYTYGAGASKWLLRLDPATPDIVDFQTVNGNPMLTDHDYIAHARASAPLGNVVGYEFDGDGDGTFEKPGSIDSIGGTATFRYSAPGHYPLSVRATTDRGGSATGRPTLGLGYLDVRPNPPPGAVGVSIDDGAIYTNTPKVEVSLVWPPLALDALIANDGGLKGATKTALAPAVPWTLTSSGSERLPKHVYVRYEGLPNDVLVGGGTSNPAITYSDDIILDQTAPKLASATLVGGSAATAAIARAHRFKVRLRARDSNSGLGAVQIATRKRKGAPVVRYRRVVVFKGPRAPKFARVRDKAGNFSKWRRIR